MLSSEELILVKGGSISVTGKLIDSILSLFNFVYDLGKNLGAAIKQRKC